MSKTKKSEFYSKIQILQRRYLSLKDGKESLLNIINETEVSEQVYNSNAIENSTLTLEETEKILLQIDLDRYVEQRELFETTNLARVVKYISQNATQKELNVEMILFLHKMLIGNIRDEIAGRFRQDNEWVKVGNHIGANPKDVEELVREALADFYSSEKNIVDRIATFHLKFENIHPFVDGNGRLGRVLVNYLLIRYNHVPINIKFVERSEYYDAFEEFNKSQKTKIMSSIVGRMLTSSYHKRLAYLEGKKIVTLIEYSKIHQTSLSNLLNKSYRQTIESFWEKGRWKIGY